MPGNKLSNLSTELFITSVLLGAGLAMDAFSVSVANGLADSGMKKRRMFLIAGTFAFFQFAMPMAGWFLVTRAAEMFEWFRPLIPWIALVLLLFIGGGLLKDGITELRGNKAGNEEKDRQTGTEKLTLWALLVQGVATSIDALSVGFTTADYVITQALASSLIIGAVTLLICMAGLLIGRRIGELLQGRASILGGLILIGIGLEIWVKGVFF